MKNILILLIAILILSCDTKKEEELAKASVIQVMTTPIYENATGNTELIYADYLGDIKPDSISLNVGIAQREGVNIDSVFTFEVDEIEIGGAPFVTHITLWTKGIRNDIPVFRSTSKTIEIPYSGNFKNVRIKGEFTNWAPQDTEVVDGKIIYRATVPQGKFQYLFLEGGKEEKLTGNEPNVVSNGMGGFNRVIDNSRKANPAQLSYGEILDQGFTFQSTGELDNVVILYENQKIEAQKEGNTFTVQLPKVDFSDRISKTQLVRVYASDENGRTNDLLIPVQDSQVVKDPTKLARSDFHTQVLYFMMVDRFLDGDTSNTKPVPDPEILPAANYMGGDLAGVLEKINDGYFEEMGINTIWLSPITQNPEGAYGLWPEPRTKFSGYHGYWPISNTKVDYRFGDEKVMKEIIEEAHKRDMNVILDYVANHVHEEHPVYKNHPEWATNLYLEDGSLNTERWDDQRLTTWFDTFMPTLDFSKPEVVEKMTDSALYWVTEYKLDGFRHDATKHVPEEYWRTLTQKVRNNTDRPIYQIGETYGSYDLIRSYVSTGMLDAQFDFNQYDAAVSAFAKADSDYANLTETLKKGLEYYGHHHLMGNISGNQDRARFISYASGDVRFDEDAKKAGWTRDIVMSDSTAYDRLGMLQAFNMTMPGVPVIYYGDEYGSIGANDPDNRRMMKFDNLSDRETNLRELVQELVKLRRNSMSLLYGTTQVMSESNGILDIQRRYFGEQTTVFFNETGLILNMVANNERFRESGTAINAVVTDKNIQIKPGNFMILQMKDEKSEEKK
ncbi:glycosidase [Nonlabens dokdonensis]|uniref:Alpha-amylase n=2 Tax=Nonlabens dokdonensis TaxID=328515 RepID=L7W3I1_NONDD|nr:alpha-amylase family glycosyl hydrolase [Nonlabens dokdonensis]AGC76105.1 alpha-amylase [Nonlabens dokdonensis DSW-6]PZX43776.1 glycosidase [Nonlabens dokdonensis]